MNTVITENGTAIVTLEGLIITKAKMDDGGPIVIREAIAINDVFVPDESKHYPDSPSIAGKYGGTSSKNMMAANSANKSIVDTGITIAKGEGIEPGDHLTESTLKGKHHH